MVARGHLVSIHAGGPARDAAVRRTAILVVLGRRLTTLPSTNLRAIIIPVWAPRTCLARWELHLRKVVLIAALRCESQQCAYDQNVLCCAVCRPKSSLGCQYAAVQTHSTTASPNKQYSLTPTRASPPNKAIRAAVQSLTPTRASPPNKAIRATVQSLTPTRASPPNKKSDLGGSLTARSWEPMGVIEVNMKRRRKKGRGKREFPEKTRRPTVSSGTISTCEDPEGLVTARTEHMKVIIDKMTMTTAKKLTTHKVKNDIGRQSSSFLLSAARQLQQ
ncbi:hypothetical protein PR048_018968 [Dryococelus australis]|uniref:Uncharacterized protein n=1 Tax=Dryococelus australis TaxID=614101 RepID=A0ABQ9H289_9NEOP|nr:hypothetical protein PR048_018968 [Dryococelus australis]